jgi:hypothetical protein
VLLSKPTMETNLVAGIIVTIISGTCLGSYNDDFQKQTNSVAFSLQTNYTN